MLTFITLLFLGINAIPTIDWVSKFGGNQAYAITNSSDRGYVITGGIAYSGRVTSWIEKRVKFIAPVEIMPGENEMEALALGTLSVLSGEEAARDYTE